jgi:hypothetical protein
MGGLLSYGKGGTYGGGMGNTQPKEETPTLTCLQLVIVSSEATDNND